MQSVLGAAQLSWFLNDLARVNRAVTPWVLVSFHQPVVRALPPCRTHAPAPRTAAQRPVQHGADASVLCLQYNSYSIHYKEADCLRQQIEPFMYNVGVDIIMHGEPSCMRHAPPLASDSQLRRLAAQRMCIPENA